MAILLYGFTPFGHNHTNISQQIVEAIPDRRGLVKHIFPTRFDEAQFLNVANKSKPDLIIGTGQYPRGKKLRIETVARNHYRSVSHPITSPIIENGDESITLNYNLSENNETKLSVDAGKYVCNYSMYILATWTLQHHSRLAFLHIPKDYILDKAHEYIEGEINRIIN